MPERNRRPCCVLLGQDIDQSVEIDEGTAHSSRNSRMTPRPCPRRQLAHFSDRPRDKTRAAASMMPRNCAFGKKSRQPFPSGVSASMLSRPIMRASRRRRSGLGLFAPVGRLHHIGAIRQLPENPMNIRHAGEPFVHQGRPLTRERHKLWPRHQKLRPMPL